HEIITSPDSEQSRRLLGHLQSEWKTSRLQLIRRISADSFARLSGPDTTGPLASSMRQFAGAASVVSDLSSWLFAQMLARFRHFPNQHSVRRGGTTAIAFAHSRTSRAIVTVCLGFQLQHTSSNVSSRIGRTHWGLTKYRESGMYST